MLKRDLLDCLQTLSSRKVPKVDPLAPSDASRSTQFEYEILKGVHGGELPDSTEQIYNQLARHSDFIKLANINPAAYHRREWGFVETLKQWRDNIVGEGLHNVNAEVTRRARGHVIQALEDLEVSKRVHEAHIGIDKVLRNKKVWANKSDVLLRAYHTSNIPHAVDSQVLLSPAVQDFYQRTSQATLDYFRRLGLDSNDIEQIMKYSDSVAQAQAEIRAVGHQVGLSLKEIDDLGTIEDMLTPEARRLLNITEHADYKQTGLDPVNWYERSRKYNHWIPADEEAVNALLQKKGLGTVSSMLEDEGKLLDTFVNQMTPNELDFMVDSGLLAKIPWESDRIFKHITRNADLPFNDLNDIFDLDPERGIQVLADHLTHMTVNKAKQGFMVKGLVNSGLGVPRADVVTNPAQYSGFRSLLDTVPESMRKHIDNVELFDATMVHPRVAGILRADFELATNPYYLGVMGHTIKAARKWASAGMLGTTRFFGRNLIGNEGFLVAHGIRPLAYTHNVLAKMTNDLRSMITGTRRSFRSTLSESDKLIWDEGVKLGILGTDTMFGSAPKHLSGRSMSRNGKMLQWLANAYPDKMSQALGLSLATGAEDLADDTVYRYINYVNQLTDDMGKWTMVKHIMSKHRSPIGDIFTDLPRHSNPRKAWEVVEKNFYMFDDLPSDSGAFDFTSSLVPFLGWRVKNMQQTFRYVVANPGKFSTVLRLITDNQQEFAENHPMEWYSMHSPFVNETRPVIPFRVGRRFSGTGQDEFYTTDIGMFLPQLSAGEDWGNVFRAFGLGERTKQPPSRRRDNPFAEHETIMLRMLREEGAPLIHLAADALTGVDKYGRKLETLERSNKQRTVFGLPVSPMTHHVLKTFLPAFRAAEDALSYTGLLGRSTEVDPRTGKVTEGLPAWTGRIPDYPVKAQHPSVLGAVAPVADLTGIAPYHVDTILSQGFKMTEVKFMLYEGKNLIRSTKRRLELAPDHQTRKERAAELRELVTWYTMLGTEYKILDNWRKEQGLITPKAYSIIQQRNMQIRDLVDQEERLRIQQQTWDELSNLK